MKIKRIHVFVFIGFLLLLLYTSTALWNKKVSNSGSITIASPMTLARSSLYAYNHQEQYLLVQLTKGKYMEDWSPSPFIGRNWVGEFRIQLVDGQGHVLLNEDLNKLFKQKSLRFNRFFSIKFADYNHDGSVDFTLGQYGSSNGNVYQIFTIKNDRISVLPVEGHPDLFISSHAYSVSLDQVNEDVFQISYYDNSLGKNMVKRYYWNGHAFVGMK